MHAEQVVIVVVGQPAIVGELAVVDAGYLSANVVPIVHPLQEGGKDAKGYLRTRGRAEIGIDIDLLRGADRCRARGNAVAGTQRKHRRVGAVDAAQALADKLAQLVVAVLGYPHRRLAVVGLVNVLQTHAVGVIGIGAQDGGRAARRLHHLGLQGRLRKAFNLIYLINSNYSMKKAGQLTQI